MIRRIAAAAATTATALTLTSASMAGALVEPTVIDDGTGDARVVPISNTIATVNPGDTQWIAINWTALGGDARELKVTAVGSDGVDVSYPTFPVDGTYSSGYWDDTLTQSEIDFTALKLRVASDAVGPQFLRVTVSYISDSGPQSEVFEMPFDNVVVVPPSTTVPTTAAPTTAAPTTAVPTTAVPTTAAPTTTEASTTTTAAPIPEVLRFYLVSADTDERLIELTGGEVIDMAEYGDDITIEAEANAATESVRYIQNGRVVKIEEWEPYAIVGDHNFGDFVPWGAGVGDYTITATPFAGDTATGLEGIERTVSFEVVDSSRGGRNGSFRAW